jgi:septum site-determining protein MinD
VDGVDFSVTPPGLFDTILIVTTPDTLSARACRDEARVLYSAGAKNIRLVINRVPPEVVPIHGVEDFDALINMIGVQLIGVIPESPKLSYAANHSKMLDEESITIRVFDNLAARLRGEGRPLLIQ